MSHFNAIRYFMAVTATAAISTAAATGLALYLAKLVTG